MLSLIVLQGPGKGRVFRFHGDTPIVLGRQSGCLRLLDPQVSRRHAEINLEGSTWVIRDLDSANGTFINGRRIDQLTELEEGDQLTFGPFVLVVGQLSVEPPTMEDTSLLDAASLDHVILSPHLPAEEQSHAAEELMRVEPILPPPARSEHPPLSPDQIETPDASIFDNLPVANPQPPTPEPQPPEPQPPEVQPPVFPQSLENACGLAIPPSPQPADSTLISQDLEPVSSGIVREDAFDLFDAYLCDQAARRDDSERDDQPDPATQDQAQVPRPAQPPPPMLDLAAPAGIASHDTASLEIEPHEVEPHDIASHDAEPHEIAQPDLVPSEIPHGEITPGEITPGEIVQAGRASSEIARSEITPSEVSGREASGGDVAPVQPPVEASIDAPMEPGTIDPAEEPLGAAVEDGCDDAVHLPPPLPSVRNRRRARMLWSLLSAVAMLGVAVGVGSSGWLGAIGGKKPGSSSQPAADPPVTPVVSTSPPVLAKLTPPPPERPADPRAISLLDDGPALTRLPPPQAPEAPQTPQTPQSLQTPPLESLDASEPVVAREVTQPMTAPQGAAIPASSEPASTEASAATQAQAEPSSHAAERVALEGSRVAYLVDASGSLLDTLPQVLLWLDDALYRMDPSLQYTVIFFRAGEAVEVPPAGLKTAADREMIRAVRRWIAWDAGNVTPSGRSDPRAAIERALSYGVGQVYLLSDGRSGDRLSDEQVADFLLRVEQRVGSDALRVHGVQFFHEASSGLLTHLARRYPGEHRFIAAPRPQGDPMESLSAVPR